MARRCFRFITLAHACRPGIGLALSECGTVWPGSEWGTALSEGIPPPLDHKQFPRREERPKDQLVATGQPKRATAPIQQQDGTFRQHQAAQNGRQPKVPARLRQSTNKTQTPMRDISITARADSLSGKIFA